MSLTKKTLEIETLNLFLERYTLHTAMKHTKKTTGTDLIQKQADR